VLKRQSQIQTQARRHFTPFTGASFINDCLLQPILHVNHPLLQFADIADSLLSTVALFSRFFSHRIQTAESEPIWMKSGAL